VIFIQLVLNIVPVALFRTSRLDVPSQPLKSWLVGVISFPDCKAKS